MSERNVVLVVVHPGSALESADFNLGPGPAAAARQSLIEVMANHHGPVLVIHGELSDEIADHPVFEAALSDLITRNKALGHVAQEVEGDDNAVFNQEAAIAAWVDYHRLTSAQATFQVTGAWYHSDSAEGCVGSVIDKLRVLGFEAALGAGALDLDAPSLPTNWPENLDSVLARGKEAGFTGFGGDCFPGALALAKVLFPDEPVTFVGAFNRAFHETGRHIGHVAIELTGPDGIFYLDADGHPKPWEDIESWGMLDPSDLDYVEAAADLNMPWSDEVAEAVTRVVLTSDQVEAMCEPGAIDRALRQLQGAPRPLPPRHRMR